MEYLPLFHDAATAADLRVVRRARIHRVRAAWSWILRHIVSRRRQPGRHRGLPPYHCKKRLDRVAVYHSDNLDDIPPSEQWDLVVGNPPHFVDISPGELRFHDQDWKLHRRFFATIGGLLKPGGVIVLLEIAVRRPRRFAA